MESRRLKYLYILKSRAPRALRRPVESCKDSPNRRVPAGPALRHDAFGASRAASASGAARARPGPTAILPARPARGLAPSGRLDSSHDTSRTAICGVEVAPRGPRARGRAAGRAARVRHASRARATCRAACGARPRTAAGLVGRAVVFEVDEVRRRGARPPHALHPAARRPARGRRRRARARPCTPRWSRHGPRLAGPRPKRRLTGLFIGGVRVRVDLY